ncbi:MAG: hypothetical protein AAGD11_01235 [Planctomycetota bacterium]
MASRANQNWPLVAIIAGALLGWMGILAAGAYWAPVGDGDGGDHRKLWVVAATTGGFLLLWVGVLLRFASKQRRSSAASADRAENAEHTRPH